MEERLAPSPCLRGLPIRDSMGLGGLRTEPLSPRAGPELELELELRLETGLGLEAELEMELRVEVEVVGLETAAELLLIGSIFTKGLEGSGVKETDV